jgi:hypothetical protein
MGVDPDEVLKRQIEYFRSDELLRERAAPYVGMSPAECWAETRELCGMLDWFLDRMEPDVRARALEPEPLSAELVAILEAMQRR